MKNEIALGRFLEKETFPGKILFAKLWGSRSHNTHKEDSDYDYCGVYVCPTKQILSLNPPQDTCEQDKAVDKSTDQDYQFHEVYKFCKLLMKGNPGIVEMLFTKKFCIYNHPWQKLWEERKRFLTKQVVKSYLGYMDGQLKRLSKGSYLHTTGGDFNEKWAYHIVRLGYDAQLIAMGKEPEIWKEGYGQLTLMKIRNNQFKRDDIMPIINTIYQNIETLKPWDLPEKGDEQFLNDWLLEIREMN